MRKLGLAAATIFTLLLLVGCGSDATDNNEGGAKAKVTQLVKESIGNQHGPEVVKTVKVNITKFEKGATDGRMFVNGDLEYKLDGWKENGVDQIRYVTTKFHYELQHNGTEWTVRNKMFFDEERRAKK
ncbi:hypothetical protein GE107_01545 [Cohnella sp. CFH 77786]|uniref:hypothetical protein n=1 Tax=Cohnella sp. CFH 77786 TaxID=2662265 RepID=UPI001C6085C8|nr:hypothetical protein [Cohnella sp. CFH 77786]MBW5444749.1 hypothetical protein [Cohnella sp. CFH 77786]